MIDCKSCKTLVTYLSILYGNIVFKLACRGVLDTFLEMIMIDINHV